MEKNCNSAGCRYSKGGMRIVSTKYYCDQCPFCGEDINLKRLEFHTLEEIHWIHCPRKDWRP